MMTKDQSDKFNKMFETTINWGDNENCIGLFANLLPDDVEQESHNLYYLTTCVQEDKNQIEILSYDGGCYYDLIGFIPLNSKTKSTLKKVVTELLNGGTFKDLLKLI